MSETRIPSPSGDLVSTRAVRGAGQIERFGVRPNRDVDRPSLTIRSGGGSAPYGFIFLTAEDDVVKVCLEQGAILQSYPDVFVWGVGARLQIANAVPPLLAGAVLSGLWEKEEQ